MAEKERKENFCKCYEMVRKDFMRLTKDFINIGGEYPLTNALDNLRAIELMDSRLIAGECISLSEAAKRRLETGKMIDEVKQILASKKRVVV